MDAQDKPESNKSTKTKRTTPGRAAKTTKRKLSEEVDTRAVKQKIDPKMALTLDLRGQSLPYLQGLTRIPI